MTLLAAYEDFTRRETVCLEDDNFQLMLKLQEKKAAVLAELGKLQDEGDEQEKLAFKKRIAALREQEEINSQLLVKKMGANREEYRKLTQNAVSAGKLRRAYSNRADQVIIPGDLQGRA